MQLAGDLARPAVSDALSINLRHRQHLHGRIGQEHSSAIGRSAAVSRVSSVGISNSRASRNTRLRVMPAKMPQSEAGVRRRPPRATNRSEEHTSELQSLAYLVCRLLLEKKKKNTPEQSAHRSIK